MNIDETLSYIHAVCWRSSIPGLERIRALLALMGDPQKDMKFIHVTGTNGKGSTCAIMASILRAAGYRTGLYTSPFLIRFNERMQAGRGAPGCHRRRATGAFAICELGRLVGRF